MKGKPVGVARICVTSPSVKEIVMIMTKASAPFTKTDVMRDMGRVLAASLTSSAVWD
jgi:hypothetical protein